MSRPTAGAERLVVLGGFPAVAPRLGRAVPWVLVGATVLVQIVYPLMPDALRTEITVASVLVFCAAALADAGRVHGLRGAAVLLAVAGGGGLLVEAVGVHTGMPFGAYAYTGDLGAEVLGVPAVVPLAWTMMAWPALVVGRTLAHPDPGLPLVPGVPLTNYGGWLLVSVVMIGALDRLLPRHTAPSGPAAALYLWTYGSSVLAHVVFFDRPGSALVGGLVMGTLAVPFAWVLWTTAPRTARTRRDQSA